MLELLTIAGLLFMSYAFYKNAKYKYEKKRLNL
jgi:hypothetical protein